MAIILSLFTFFSLPPLLRASEESPEKVEYLLRALQEESSLKVKLQAINFMAQMTQDQRAIKALIAALKNDHYVIRAAAAAALGKLKPFEGKAALEEALKDANPLVRREAERALSLISQPPVQEIVPVATPSLAVKGQVLIHITPGKACAGGGHLLEDITQFLKDGIGQVSGLTLEPHQAKGGSVDGRLSFTLRGNVVRINEEGSGVRCEVSLEVLGEPRMNLVMITNGEALVRGGSDRESMARSALRVAVASVIEDLVRFLSR